MFVSSLLRRAAALWPRNIAVIDGTVELDYVTLVSRVARLANGLLGLGLSPGDRVLDIQKNGHTYLETDLACAIAGLVRVPVNVRLTPSEWAYIAADSGARGLIYGIDFEEAIEGLSEISALDVCVRVGGSGHGRGRNLDDVLADARDSIPRRGGRPNEIVSLNYSSGTTGRPKGCIRTAANRFASLMDMLQCLFCGALQSDDVFLHAGPMTHASGLFVLPHIAVGGAQVILNRFDAEEVRGRLNSQRITGTVLVPTMLERVLATLGEDVAPTPFPALRRLAYAGAPMPPDRIGVAYEALAGRLVQFYGLVEAIPPITVLTPDDHASPALRASAGQPVLGAAIEIVDDNGATAPPGQTGELVLGGMHVMDGYWGNEEATVKSVRAGWLHSGDLARQDERGYITLVDRKADMIITGGFNVMPREVELALRDFPGVAEVAVVGLPDPDWGEAVTAFIVQEAGAAVDPIDLERHCAANLSGFKKPKRIEFIEELPKASTGKISRSALRALAAQRRVDG